MVYVVTKQSPKYRQMTLEELLFDNNFKPVMISNDPTTTRTYELESVGSNIRNRVNLAGMISALADFNTRFEKLHSVDKKTLYYTFYTAKKGKGMPNVFKKIFSSQKKYVNCDSHEVCSGIAQRIFDLTSNHKEEVHDELFKTTETSVLDFLSSKGFDVSKIDFKEIISDSFRKIDAPDSELKTALTLLKNIFETDFGVLYHTSAFAYIKNRNTVSAIKKHQSNESRWFGKFDLSNFFGSTTIDFVMKQFSMIFPFSEIMAYESGENQLRKALELAFLNGGLPQGTPISPIITNVMMIPIDYKLANGFKSFKKSDASTEDKSDFLVYTRYADDFLVSSKYNFDYKEVENYIVKTLALFDAPFTIKSEKTRYGSSAGSNWNLGVMLNKDNKITVGYKKKRQFQAMLASYVMDKKNGKQWSKNDVLAMDGFRNYYKMVEGDVIDNIVNHVGKKFGVNIVDMIKDDLKA